MGYSLFISWLIIHFIQTPTRNEDSLHPVLIMVVGRLPFMPLDKSSSFLIIRYQLDFRISLRRQIKVIFSNHDKNFHEHQVQAKVCSRDPTHRPKETPDYAF